MTSKRLGVRFVCSKVPEKRFSISTRRENGPFAENRGRLEVTLKIWNRTLTVLLG